MIWPWASCYKHHWRSRWKSWLNRTIQFQWLLDLARLHLNTWSLLSLFLSHLFNLSLFLFFRFTFCISPCLRSLLSPLFLLHLSSCSLHTSPSLFSHPVLFILALPMCFPLHHSILPLLHRPLHPPRLTSCLDRERHVPEQDQGAAGPGEDQRALLPSLLCVLHLRPPLPHRRARHPQLGGGGARGAGGPQAGGRCRRSRREQWRTSERGGGAPAPVSHLPEHHRRACPLHGDHDRRWVSRLGLGLLPQPWHPTPHEPCVLLSSVWCICWCQSESSASGPGTIERKDQRCSAVRDPCLLSGY